MKHLIFNIILLLAAISYARVSDRDFVIGKLLQIQNTGTDECGISSMLLVSTDHGDRFIETHSKEGVESKYINFKGEQVKIEYTESIGAPDCQSGIKSIKLVK
jgi:hypothetical protein